MDVNTLLAQLTDYRAMARNVSLKNLALEAKNRELENKIEQLETEKNNLHNRIRALDDLSAVKEKHLTAMVRQARERQSIAETNLTGLIRTMAPFKKRQDQILLEIKKITETVRHSSDDNNSAHTATVDQHGQRATPAIITLPPTDHSRLQAPIQQRAATMSLRASTEQPKMSVATANLRVPIDPRGPKIPRGSIIMTPPPVVSPSPSRQAESTETDRETGKKRKISLPDIEVVHWH